MESHWHHAFNPQKFLKGVDVEQLLEREDPYPNSRTNKLGKPCLSCGGFTAPGLLLNEGSYLCKQCFDRISLVQYPEKHERLRRQHRAVREARTRARKSLIQNSPDLRNKKIATTVFWLSFLLYFIHIAFIGLTVGIFFVATRFEAAHRRRLTDWDNRYPEQPEPILRHFHDPAAELTPQDKETLYIFDHWPGNPPFWGYLREVVLREDRGRCQVTGCPSRLELHIHHIKPRSQGGQHSPGNLVTLCDFHHALEPERGHERIWSTVKTRYFTLVCEHERSNKVTAGTHAVRAHLRRLQLVTLEELRELINTYGLGCPQCGNLHIKVALLSGRNKIEVECPACAKSIQGPQELAEETGARLAEVLRVTRNHGRWKARWDMLSERKREGWDVWIATDATKKRKEYKKRRVEQDLSKPVCTHCGASMRVIRPRPNDTWNPFWGCTQFRVTGCKGKRPIR